MSKLCSIILAAGEGKRMKSSSPKVLSEVLFKPMLKWVVDSVNDSGIKNVCVVAGYKSEEIENYLSFANIHSEIALQKERKGTAHAVMMATEFLQKNLDSDVLILGGDAPFIDSKTIKDSYALHKRENNSATVISAKLDNPYGYGRIVRDKDSLKLNSIVEEKDANEIVKNITEVNSGVYWFKVADLLSVLTNISNNNAQGEYYLPDAICLLLEKGKSVNAFVSDSPEIVMGANDCMQLYDLNRIAKDKVLNSLMNDGIRIPFTDGVIIGTEVKIKRGTTILPGTIIDGNTSVGENCIIGPNSQIHNSIIENNVVFNSSYCKDSYINSNQKIGPFDTVINNNDAFGIQF